MTTNEHTIRVQALLGFLMTAARSRQLASLLISDGLMAQLARDPLLHALQAAAAAAPADARHFRGYLHYGVGDPRNGEPSPHYQCLVSVMQLVTTLLQTTHGDEGPVRKDTVAGALEFVRTYSQLIGTSLMSLTDEVEAPLKAPAPPHGGPGRGGLNGDTAASAAGGGVGSGVGAARKAPIPQVTLMQLREAGAGLHLLAALAEERVAWQESLPQLFESVRYTVVKRVCEWAVLLGDGQLTTDSDKIGDKHEHYMKTCVVHVSKDEREGVFDEKRLKRSKDKMKGFMKAIGKTALLKKSMKAAANSPKSSGGFLGGVLSAQKAAEAPKTPSSPKSFLGGGSASKPPLSAHGSINVAPPTPTGFGGGFGNGGGQDDKKKEGISQLRIERALVGALKPALMLLARIDPLAPRHVSTTSAEHAARVAYASSLVRYQSSGHGAAQPPPRQDRLPAWLVRMTPEVARRTPVPQYVFVHVGKSHADTVYGRWCVVGAYNVADAYGMMRPCYTVCRERSHELEVCCPGCEGKCQGKLVKQPFAGGDFECVMGAGCKHTGIDGRKDPHVCSLCQTRMCGDCCDEELSKLKLEKPFDTGPPAGNKAEA